MLSGHAPVVMLALAVSLAACATPPAPETIATSQRTYQGVSAELVLDAAAEVIELADPYTTVERYPGMVRGEPDWWLFVLSFQLVWETWVVTAAEDNGAVKASARFTSARVVGPDVEAIEPSIYNMLWQRVDYMLGLRPDWPECPKYAGQLGLCGAFSEDLRA